MPQYYCNNRRLTWAANITDEKLGCILCLSAAAKVVVVIYNAEVSKQIYVLPPSSDVKAVIFSDNKINTMNGTKLYPQASEI